MTVRRVKERVRIVKKPRVFRFEGADEYNPPLIDYGSMSRDQLVDHFIDDGGLAHFIDVQMAGVDASEWNWTKLASDLRGFNSYLTFSAEYLHQLYSMQKERAA
jgi:hypothetical protein